MTILVTGDTSLGGCSGKPPYHRPDFIPKQIGWNAVINGKPCRYRTDQTPVPQCPMEHYSKAERGRVFNMVGRLAHKVKEAAELRSEPILITKGPGASGMIAWHLEKLGATVERISAIDPIKTYPTAVIMITEDPIPGGDLMSWGIAQKCYRSSVIIQAVPSRERFVPITAKLAKRYMLDVERADINWLRKDTRRITDRDQDLWTARERSDADDTVSRSDRKDLSIRGDGQEHWIQGLEAQVMGGWIEATIPWDLYAHPLPRKAMAVRRDFRKSRTLPSRMECPRCHRWWAVGEGDDAPLTCTRHSAIALEWID